MTKTLLHVGCGHQALPAWLGEFDEIRLDIDPDVQPDIVASMTDLGDIGPFDAIYTTHTLEHLFPHEVGQALREFRRVLAPGGFALIIVPDLEDVKPTEDVLYESPAGPICGLDMIYGSSRMTASNPYMAHKCGFVRETLKQAVERAGFEIVSVERDHFNLIAAAA